MENNYVIKKNVLYKKYNLEVIIFLTLFLILFSSIKLNTTAGSNGNVEQWLNLTNLMFYGHQDFLFSQGPLLWLNAQTASPYNFYTYWVEILFISLVNAFFWTISFKLIYKAHNYLLFFCAYFLFFSNLMSHLPIMLLTWFN